jgi:hypothetical protein
MKIRLLAHFILLFAVATALPFEGNSQALLLKTYKAIKRVPIRIHPEIKRIPPIVPIPISDFTKDQTVLPKVTTVSVPILIDTTVVSEIRNRNRMITLLMMSRERLDSTRRAWQSLLNSKVYEDYQFEQSRLQMLTKIAWSSKYEDTPEDALKIMEAIYNREAIVLPHVKMDIPKFVE